MKWYTEMLFVNGSIFTCEVSSFVKLRTWGIVVGGLIQDLL